MPEQTTSWKPFFELDCRNLGLLPENWLDDIQSVVEECGVDTLLEGGDSNFTEESARYAGQVRVVFGENCHNKLQWLTALYENEFRIFAENSIGGRYFTANEKKFSININCITGIGGDYEKHKDTNPCTGLLFCCHADEKTGGQLVFVNIKGHEVALNPYPGLFVVFDAREITHYVSELKMNFDRTSVPMNYYEDKNDQYMPLELQNRLQKTDELK